MELLNPSLPPHHFAGLFSPVAAAAAAAAVDFNNLRFGSGNCMASSLPLRAECVVEQVGGRGSGGGEVAGGDDKVYVVVESSVERTVSLLRWSFKQFTNREICLVHVYQPSPTIPTLLGKLPASQANKELLSAYREEERERNTKLLFNYLAICTRSKIKASLITVASGQVHKGIVELISSHHIKNLVMETKRDNYMKVKKRSFCNADYAAKNGPPFCEMWFVNKGRHIWTREATQGFHFKPSEAALIEGLGSLNCNNETVIDRGYLGESSCSSTRSHDRTSGNCKISPDQLEVALAATGSSFMNRISESSSSSTSSSSSLGYTPIELRGSSGLDSNIEEEMLYNKLIEATRESEKAKDEAFAEMLERRRLESEAAETMNKVKDIEVARTRELQLRNKIEAAISSVRTEQEKALEQRENISGELQRKKRNVAFFDSRVQEVYARQKEASRELKLIQASVAVVQIEKQKIQRHRDNAMLRFDQWKNHGHVGASNYDEFALQSDSEELREFSLLDLESATCNFSESFKIGNGEFGCVYKGELLDKSVAIKKLHPFKIRSRLEFQKEVQTLSKLRHPNLVCLIGSCPEAWSMVYEYMPNGSIQDHLFSKTNKHLLPWKTRTRIVAEIASALLSLHSSNPEKIVHGDLKPENILLDSEFNCKITDFGIRRLVSEDNARCPSFGRSSEPNSALPYKDPELWTTGNETLKSDIYSFGVIILQLLTGRSPAGLVSEVRRALFCGRIVSILDKSAGEWPTFIARRLVELGLQCCEMNSRERPQLTPNLVHELENLPLAEERTAPSFFLCPIFQEIMHDPHVAADGFTYEGEAMRGWLKNGRDTSPMTNLKLSHLHLTPNRALQLAIRDWLCQA